jgi:endonuclease/exonuclease/phosphatase (EEP) superfamily protein YafD
MQGKSSLRATAVYLTLLFTWAVFWWFTGDRFWLLTLINRMVPFLFVPVPMFVLQHWRQRQWWGVGLSALPIVLFMALYWPYLLPHRAAGTAADLRVLTYNVLFTNMDATAVAQNIRHYHPDLVALQEVQPEMMAALEALLGDEFPFAVMGGENAYGTTAVFSRHPFTETTILDLGVDRPAVVVTMMLDEQPVTFISAHLLAYGLVWVPIPDIPAEVNQRTHDQNRQAQIILDEAERRGNVVILACDCNTKETSSTYNLLRRAMVNAARQVGWQVGDRWHGAKSEQNLQHIDYVFYAGAVRATAVYRLNKDGGSDHQPILALFDLAD